MDNQWWGCQFLEVNELFVTSLLGTGTKKWITNGTFADYFTVGCKTEVRFLSFSTPTFDQPSAHTGWIYCHTRRAWSRRRDEADQNELLFDSWHCLHNL
jgi:alkylation response protein AidB-like acyl-CoA dehydrogenase